MPAPTGSSVKLSRASPSGRASPAKHHLNDSRKMRHAQPRQLERSTQRGCVFVEAFLAGYQPLPVGAFGRDSGRIRCGYAGTPPTHRLDQWSDMRRQAPADRELKRAL